jgi:predicted O-linked N-acetylglucosamine transferase (SPINDLY family)
LPENGVVLACFNAHQKYSAEVFAAWMRVLRSCPDAVLWLLDGGAELCRRLSRYAAASGVEPARLVWAPRKPAAAHLARLQLADLFLDTYPYAAHTTASDALWAGCPVLTRCGASFSSRVAASLLGAVELPGLVAGSAEEYERRALELAGDRAHLRSLRAHLEQGRRAFPLFASGKTARAVEQAYERMWKFYEAGQAPESFAV